MEKKEKKKVNKTNPKAVFVARNVQQDKQTNYFEDPNMTKPTKIIKTKSYATSPLCHHSIILIF
jgi:hypothetical protein